LKSGRVGKWPASSTIDSDAARHRSTHARQRIDLRGSGDVEIEPATNVSSAIGRTRRQPMRLFTLGLGRSPAPAAPLFFSFGSALRLRGGIGHACLVLERRLDRGN
jgi:hypothetical protein